MDNENIVNIRVKIPIDFSSQLDDDISAKKKTFQASTVKVRSELKKKGVKVPSKAELIIKYAQIGRMQEMKHNEETA
jgi:uncharacterized Zn finger protein